MKRKKNLILAACLLCAFALWTAALCFADVRPIGPLGSEVGFAALNSFVHGLTGVHMSLYVLTDWLSILPLCIVLGFALLGLCQWINRKKLGQVDRSILVLGGFYVAAAAAFLSFEMLVINYRPVLIDGVLEASYPSSTTMLVLCVMLTAVMQLKKRIKKYQARESCVLRHVRIYRIYGDCKTVFRSALVFRYCWRSAAQLRTCDAVRSLLRMKKTTHKGRFCFMGSCVLCPACGKSP